MINIYDIRGDHTAIFLNSRKYGLIETLIDTEDLSRVMEHDRTWYACWNNDVRNFYVTSGLKVNGKWTTIPLHRWILKSIKGSEVDHKNHDTLDNRRHNLIEGTHADNMKNKRPYRKTRKI